MIPDEMRVIPDEVRMIPDEMRVEAGELVRALKVVDQLSGGHGGDAQQYC